MYWYEDEILRLDAEKEKLKFQPLTIFYGSSSIRQWDTLQEDFKDFNPFNLGFGGSTLEACVWYFKRLFTDLSPNSLIVYAGDNDLGDGKQPEEVFQLFKQLADLVHERFGNIPVGYISIKPSLARIGIIDKIKKTNSLIENEINSNYKNMCFVNIFHSMLDENGKPCPEYFMADGLHINQKGYKLWKEIILKYVSSGELVI